MWKAVQMGRRSLVLENQRFGNWTVIKRSGNDEEGAVRWFCRCDCGNESTINGSNLRRGQTSQCVNCSRHIVQQTRLAEARDSRARSESFRKLCCLSHDWQRSRQASTL